MSVSNAGPGTDLSFVVRMDFRVLDAEAVTEAARAAAISADPLLSDAELAVEVGTGVEDALFAIVNAVGLDALIEDTPGLEVRAVATEVAYGLEEITFDEEGND